MSGPKKEGPPIAVQRSFGEEFLGSQPPLRGKGKLMTEPYIPYTNSTSSSTGLLASLFVPQQTAPASSTRVTQPTTSVIQSLRKRPLPKLPTYNNDFAKPTPWQPMPKPTFNQLIQSIKDIDSLVVLPEWHNYMNNERALELTRVLRDYGGYNGLEWKLTSGFANPRLDSLIRYRFPDYPRNFAQKGELSFKGVLIPGTNIGLDVPHFNATLSRYLDNDIYRRNIPADWAGWAGDIFTFAKQLDSLHQVDGLGIDSLRILANHSLGNPKPIFKSSFGQEDFYADIDARNISELINNGLSFHDAMDNYYNNGLYSRFGHFVNSYGGWKNFIKRVNSYTFFPKTPFVNPIFVEAAKQAFTNKIREGCLNEMDCYIP